MHRTIRAVLLCFFAWCTTVFLILCCFMLALVWCAVFVFKHCRFYYTMCHMLLAKKALSGKPKKRKGSDLGKNSSRYCRPIVSSMLISQFHITITMSCDQYACLIKHKDQKGGKRAGVCLGSAHATYTPCTNNTPCATCQHRGPCLSIIFIVIIIIIVVVIIIIINVIVTVMNVMVIPSRT